MSGRRRRNSAPSTSAPWARPTCRPRSRAGLIHIGSRVPQDHLGAVNARHGPAPHSRSGAEASAVVLPMVGRSCDGGSCSPLPWWRWFGWWSRFSPQPPSSVKGRILRTKALEEDLDQSDDERGAGQTSTITAIGTPPTAAPLRPGTPRAAMRQPADASQRGTVLRPEAIGERPMAITDEPGAELLPMKSATSFATGPRAVGQLPWIRARPTATDTSGPGSVTLLVSDSVGMDTPSRYPDRMSSAGGRPLAP